MTLEPISIATIGYVCRSTLAPIPRATHGYVCPVRATGILAGDGGGSNAARELQMLQEIVPIALLIASNDDAL